MSTAEIAIQVPRPRPRALCPLATLARRRFQLSARIPRELFVPLLTPIMFALVIAPALKTALDSHLQQLKASAHDVWRAGPCRFLHSGSPFYVASSQPSPRAEPMLAPACEGGPI